MGKAFSIRNPLQGELADFLRESNFINCTATDAFVRDLTCLLAAYREEDVALYPAVFIVKAPEDVACLSPGTERISIGRTDLESLSAAMVLKDCAPLAEDGWAIYVGKTGTPPAFEFGVFRSHPHAYATTAEELLLDDGFDTPAILIRNRGHLVVELRNAFKGTMTVSLTSALAAESDFAEHVSMFVDAMSSRIPVKEKTQFSPYMQRLLSQILQRCHGTLCGVYRTPRDNKCPEQFSKGVWLKTPLRSYSAIPSQ